MKSNTLKELLSHYNILKDITILKDETEYLRVKTNELDTTIHTAASLDRVSSLPTYPDLNRIRFEIDEVHSEITKVFNEIVNINTQMDELYSDIQDIKNILNI